MIDLPAVCRGQMAAADEQVPLTSSGLLSVRFRPIADVRLTSAKRQLQNFD
jgi:hypothetical protein